MTIPTMMNCEHSSEGWCLECVTNLANQLQEALEDSEETTKLQDRLRVILTDTINILRGKPPKLTLWSWHDIPERAKYLKNLLIQERAKNIRLQIRAEDCGKPSHDFPDGQGKIDRSVNEEVLAKRQITALLAKELPK